MNVDLITGDCLEILLCMPDDSIDSLITDPPSGIGFMGLDWDLNKGGFGQWVEWMAEVMKQCLRVLKPGAHGVVWSLPKTSHWTGLSLELAGFEIKDVIPHIFGQGMPKGGLLKKILAKQGVEQSAADEFGEWSYNLKPASEFWWLVQKPISESSIIKNVLKHRTGALNIGACRIGHTEVCKEMGPQGAASLHNPKLKQGGRHAPTLELKPEGRWPSHVILSHAPGCLNAGKKQVKNTSGSISNAARSEETSHTYGELKEPRNFERHGGEDGLETVDDWRCVPGCPVLLMGEQSGVSISTGGVGQVDSMFFGPMSPTGLAHAGGVGDEGTAARYFRQLEHEPFYYTAKPAPGEKTRDGIDDTNTHVTVKPVSLMQEFCKLLTPAGGTILDPFNGSGTTGVAAVMEGFSYIGIDRDPEFIAITKKRMSWRQLSLI